MDRSIFSSERAFQDNCDCNKETPGLKCGHGPLKKGLGLIDYYKVLRWLHGSDSSSRQGGEEKMFVPASILTQFSAQGIAQHV
jgi:hypothetical protein